MSWLRPERRGVRRAPGIASVLLGAVMLFSAGCAGAPVDAPDAMPILDNESLDELELAGEMPGFWSWYDRLIRWYWGDVSPEDPDCRAASE